MSRRTLLLVTALIGGTAATVMGCGGPKDEVNPDKDKAALERFETSSDGATDMGGSKAGADAVDK